MRVSYPGAEGRHASKDNNPKWNESYFFEFYDPKSTVGGVIRVGILENTNTTNLWFILFKDGKLVYNRFCAAAPYTSDRMDEGIDVANVRLTSIEHLTKAVVEYTAEHFSMNLTFDALAPMVDTIEIVKGTYAKEPFSSTFGRTYASDRNNHVTRGNNECGRRLLCS